MWLFLVNGGVLDASEHDDVIVVGDQCVLNALTFVAA